VEYLVVSTQPGQEAEIARFDSAYRAVDFITAAWFSGDPRAAHYCIVDSDGTTLLRPDDLIGIRAAEWRTPPS
jgi:hypothetical protein